MDTVNTVTVTDVPKLRGLSYFSKIPVTIGVPLFNTPGQLYVKSGRWSLNFAT